MKNFTKEELQEMGIYELRELARSFSIHRPSDKKRTDLITLILESPHMANYQELPSYVKLFEYQSALDFASDMPSRVACPGSYESHIATGYVHTSTSGGFLVASNLSSYRLTSSFMSMNNLAQCDYVDVRADFDNDRKGFVATDLIERKSQPQRRFDAMPGLRPIRKMDFGGVKMPVGGRALVTCDKTYPRYEHISDICTQLKNGPFAKNVIKIAIIAEENDFVVNYLTEKGINEIFFIKPDMPISKQLASCLYALFVAKKYATENKDVVLFIDNISKLARIYTKSTLAHAGEVATKFAIVTGGHTIGALADLKNLFMSGKAFESGSLSIVAYINQPEDGNKLEQDLYEEFSNVTNTIIRIKSDD